VSDYSPGWHPRNESDLTGMCKESRDKYDVWKYRNSIELQCSPYVGAVNTYKVYTGTLLTHGRPIVILL